ncbi:MAG: hypothetical protein JSS34_05910 [Proteobacteria bacterium]|nr:hypothetical protein [Pseudomonadota bacterium]
MKASLKLFFLVILSSLFFGSFQSLFSMEADESLQLEIADKQGQNYRVRPFRFADETSLKEMQAAHAATPKETSFITPSENSSLEFDAFERQYRMEEVGNIIEKHWAILRDEQVIGNFDFSGEEATILLHPEYRSRGIAQSALRVIHGYFEEKFNTNDLTLLPKDDEAAEELEQLFSQRQTYTYEEYKRLLQSFAQIIKHPFQGYIATVAPTNVASLKLCLASGMIPQEINQWNTITFAFGPNKETADSSFTEIVKTLTLKNEDERQKALEEFNRLYPYKEQASDDS